jgi:hypothetical protein
MSAHKCGSCGGAVPADYESTEYVRVDPSGRVKAVRSYPLCRRCYALAEIDPGRLAKAVRRTYERDAFN